MRALLALALLVSMTAAAKADCSSVNGLTPTVMTPDRSALVGGGGFLIGEVPSQNQPPGSPPRAPTWTMSGAFTETKIAPGLVVRVPTGKAASFELTDAKTKAHISTVVPTQDRGAPVPTPAVEKVTATTATSYRESGKIHFKEAVPDGIAAVVIADAKGAPREFMLVKRGDRTADPVHGHCQQDPDGTRTTSRGDTITLFYVDDHGRVSKPTKPFKVLSSTVSVKDVVKPVPLR